MNFDCYSKVMKKKFLEGKSAQSDCVFSQFTQHMKHTEHKRVDVKVMF